MDDETKRRRRATALTLAVLAVVVVVAGTIVVVTHRGDDANRSRLVVRDPQPHVLVAELRGARVRRSHVLETRLRDVNERDIAFKNRLQVCKARLNERKIVDPRGCLSTVSRSLKGAVDSAYAAALEHRHPAGTPCADAMRVFGIRLRMYYDWLITTNGALRGPLSAADEHWLHLNHGSRLDQYHAALGDLRKRCAIR